VVAYVKTDADFEGFFTRLCAMVIPLLPRYTAEGKRYLTIAIGCTGGRHRSVVVAQQLGEHLIENGHKVRVRHRDLMESPNRS